jgi:hypothetical protein
MRFISIRVCLFLLILLSSLSALFRMMHSSSYNRLYFIDDDVMVYGVLENSCSKVLDINWLNDNFPNMLIFESACKNGKDVNGTRIGNAIYGYYVYRDSNNSAYVSDAHKEDIRQLRYMLSNDSGIQLEINYYLVSDNCPENRITYTPITV